MDFDGKEAKPAGVLAHSLDPLGAIAYVATFVIVTIISMRRPCFGLATLIVAQPFATAAVSNAVLCALILGLAAHAKSLSSLTNRNAVLLLLAGAAVMTLTIAPELLKELVLFGAVFVAYRLDPDEVVTRLAVTVLTALVFFAAVSHALPALPLWSSVTTMLGGGLAVSRFVGYPEIALVLLLAFSTKNATRADQAALALAAFCLLFPFSPSGGSGAAAGILTLVFIHGRDVRLAVAGILAGLLAGGIANTWPSPGQQATFASWSFSTAWIRLATVLWVGTVSVAILMRARAQSPLVAGALAVSVAMVVSQTLDFSSVSLVGFGWWWIVLALGAAEVARVNAKKRAASCV